MKIDRKNQNCMILLPDGEILILKNSQQNVVKTEERMVIPGIRKNDFYFEGR